MEYTKGRIKNIYVLRFNDGDDVLAGLTKVVKQEKIKAGIIHLTGVIKNCRVVTWPKMTCIPPVPVWQKIKEAHEVVAFGTVFLAGKEPRIHIHLALGRGKAAYVGCLRTGSEAYLVLEGVIIEMEAKVVREYDKKSGFNLIKIIGKKGKNRS